MMHHDAITGTHLHRIGINYSDMMISQIEKARQGLLGDAIKRMALGYGDVRLEDLKLCGLEGNVVTCD